MDRHRQPTMASRTTDGSSNSLSTPSAAALNKQKKSLPTASSHLPAYGASAASAASASSSRLSKQSSVSSSRRSKKKRKEELARIIDGKGRDVTPLPLTGVYAKEQLDTAAAIAADAVAGSGGDAAGMGMGMAALQQLQWTADEDIYGLASLAPSANNAVAGLSLTAISSEQPALSSITLTETSTTTLFTLPSLRFSTATDPHIIATNDAYTALLASKKDRDRYAQGVAQTINASERDKGVQASEREVVTQGVQASSWLIWESERDTEDEGVEGGEDGQQGRLDDEARKAAEDDNVADDAAASAAADMLTSRTGGDTARSDLSASSSTSSHSSSMLSALSSHASSSNAFGTSANGTILVAASAPQLRFSGSVMSTLRALEEAVLQNVYHNAQLLYRDIAPTTLATVMAALAPPASAPVTANPTAAAPAGTATAAGSGTSASSLTHLFTFAFPAPLHPLLSSSTPNPAPLAVTSLAFNHRNPDLLAVSYGSLSYQSTLQAGLLCFFSLSLPSFPLKYKRTASSALSVDWASDRTECIAVGYASGDVAVYDARSELTGEVADALTSRHATGKHRDSVWQVKWVRRDRGEWLYSVSGDGSVMQWSMKKGLIPKQVMSLKRSTTAAANTASASASAPQSEVKEGLSRDGSGMCIDFPILGGLGGASASGANASLANQYYCGTEDGAIHRCSISYNEQTLDTYVHHTGAVHAIRCNPFTSELFLSCSHDWTVAVWSSRSERPLCVLGGGGSDVMDCVWNPVWAAVFACVTRDGWLHVYDMQQSTLDAVMSVELSGGGGINSSSVSGCCVVWSSGSVLLVGDERGRVEVWKVAGLGTGCAGMTGEEQAERLQELCWKQQQSKQAL